MVFYSKFAEYYQDIFPFKKPAFDFLNSFTKDAKRILDVGCGTGHYTAHFAEKGCEAVGIDLDASMIDYARSRYPAPTFHVLDMIDIGELEKPFDFIFCIGNTAAHLRQNDFAAFVRTVHHLLRPGGVWAFQVRNWDYVLQQSEYIFPLIEARGGRVRFERSYTDISPRRLTFNTRLTDDDRLVFQDSVTMYPITSQEYLHAHENAGFRLLQHVADFKKTPYNKDGDTANIFVFQKPLQG